MQQREPTMRRTIIAAAWVAGATVPLAVAAVFVVGCCVLPFHGLLHKALPLCHVAVDFLSGGHDDHDADHHPAPQPPQKQQLSGPSLLTTLTARTSLGRDGGGSVFQPRSSAAAHRSFIALGAIRCDQDIGLHRLLIETFRI